MSDIQSLSSLAAAPVCELAPYQPGKPLAELEREYGIRDAIKLAVECVRKGDLLLVAGKGHEDYQIVGQVKTRFDDREEILNALQEAR